MSCRGAALHALIHNLVLLQALSVYRAEAQGSCAEDQYAARWQEPQLGCTGVDPRSTCCRPQKHLLLVLYVPGANGLHMSQVMPALLGQVDQSPLQHAVHFPACLCVCLYLCRSSLNARNDCIFPCCLVQTCMSTGRLIESCSIHLQVA